MNNKLAIPVDFSREGVINFNCIKCGATETALRAVFSDTYKPICCGVEMKKT